MIRLKNLVSCSLFVAVTVIQTLFFVVFVLVPLVLEFYVVYFDYFHFDGMRSLFINLPKNKPELTQATRALDFEPSR